MTSLADILDASAKRYPNKVAIRFHDRIFTYSELKERACRLASALQALGIRKHDHVVLISPNSHVSMELLYATAQLGAVLEQSNTRLSRVIMGELLEKSEAKVAFVSGRLFQTASELTDLVSRPLEVIFFDNKCGQEDDYEDLLASAKPLTSRAEVKGSDAAVLLYTSGTTNIPSGVLLSHSAIMHQGKVDREITGVTQESVQLCVLPLFHVTFIGALEALSVGGELVILDVCKGSDIALAIKEYSVTHINLIPFLLDALTTYVEETTTTLDTLKLVLYGAEPIHIQLLEQAKRAFDCAFVQGYGMTETTAAITMLRAQDHEGNQHLATAGRPLPGVEIKVVGKDGAECSSPNVGEIIVKTEALMLGYYRDPEKTSEVIKDGWYYTGDIGYVDAEGYLHLVARKSDMIISGGENIYPQEISTCIKEMDEVVDATAVGVPDEHWGEALVAVVVKKEGSHLSGADIIDYCAEQLGHFKKPNTVYFLGKLERNPLGKISRRDVYTLLDTLKKEGTI